MTNSVRLTPEMAEAQATMWERAFGIDRQQLHVAGNPYFPNDDLTPEEAEAEARQRRQQLGIKVNPNSLSITP